MTKDHAGITERAGALTPACESDAASGICSDNTLFVYVVIANGK